MAAPDLDLVVVWNFDDGEVFANWHTQYFKDDVVWLCRLIEVEYWILFAGDFNHIREKRSTYFALRLLINVIFLEPRQLINLSFRIKPFPKTHQMDVSWVSFTLARAYDRVILLFALFTQANSAAFLLLLCGFYFVLRFPISGCIVNMSLFLFNGFQASSHEVFACSPRLALRDSVVIATVVSHVLILVAIKDAYTLNCFRWLFSWIPYVIKANLVIQIVVERGTLIGEHHYILITRLPVLLPCQVVNHSSHVLLLASIHRELRLIESSLVKVVKVSLWFVVYACD